jgi:tetrahydromethanopterin S-methyltransferase subunit E
MRWLALAGVAFVGCFAIAVLLYGSGAGSPSGEIAAYYAAPLNRLRQIAGFGALAVGAIFLMSYLAVLKHALIRDPLLAAIAQTSGAVSVALLSAANALWA